MNRYWAGGRTKIWKEKQVKILVPWKWCKEICWQVYAKHAEGEKWFLEMLQNLKNRWKHFVDDVFIKGCEVWRSDTSNKEKAMLCRDHEQAGRTSLEEWQAIMERHFHFQLTAVAGEMQSVERYPIYRWGIQHCFMYNFLSAKPCSAWIA